MIQSKEWHKYRGGEQTTNPALLAEFYADRPLMWRNIILVMIGNLGYGIAFTLISPLMLLHMKACGIEEDWIGSIVAGNYWLVSVLVMYFSWRSDRLVNRFGRRIPFLLAATPAIVATAFLFPFFQNRTVLITLWIIQILAIDMKASTFSLILIDSVPRKELARLNALSTLVPGLCSFFVLRYGMRLTEIHEALPFVFLAPLVLLTALIAGFGVVEPPIYSPSKENFKPWSTMAVSWKDKRIIWLMLGVGMISAFHNVYGMWVWLFAKVTLGLDKTVIAETLSWSSLLGVALAYPVGWVIDRFGGRKIVVVYWMLLAVMFTQIMQVHDASGLLLVALISCCALPFAGAADIMVYRSAPPEHMGSITSTNAFLRNTIAGCIAFGSGQLIRHVSYTAAFIMGICVSTVGLSMFFIHQYSMRSRPKKVASKSSITTDINRKCLVDQESD